jgi:hypothetical protein
VILGFTDSPWRRIADELCPLQAEFVGKTAKSMCCCNVIISKGTDVPLDLTDVPAVFAKFSGSK